jgi:NADH-quinone oxidoreductase subunit M
MVLSSLIILPLAGACSIFFINETSINQIRKTGILFSGITFFLSLLLFIFFDRGTADFQFVEEYTWLAGININLILGVDGISILFVLLTTLLTPICLLASWELPISSRSTSNSLKY